jgi:hypothetical protein
MRKEEFERRAAEMRDRYAAAERHAARRRVPAPSSHASSQRMDTPGLDEASLVESDFPAAAPLCSLHRIWKPLHTELLVKGLGNAHPLVRRAAQVIGTQQVAFDGLVYLRGNNIIDVAASTTMLLKAMKLCSLLLQTVEAQGGAVSVAGKTNIVIDGEAVPVRLREGSQRFRCEDGDSAFTENEYFPTGTIFLIASDTYGADIRIPVVQPQRDIDLFLQKVRRKAARLPLLRERQTERTLAQNEERQRFEQKWRNEKEADQQWREQHKRRDELITDVENWSKAKGIRAFASALEAAYTAAGRPVVPGSTFDGQLRWLGWSAEYLDPVTRYIADDEFESDKLAHPDVTHWNAGHRDTITTTSRIKYRKR